MSTEEQPQLDRHVVQTHDMFRAAGFTLAAVQYPLSHAAVAWVLDFNKAPKGWVPPHAWRYAPNPEMRTYVEQKAAATGVKPGGDELTHDGLTVSKSCGPEQDKREPRNSPAAPLQQFRL